MGKRKRDDDETTRGRTASAETVTQVRPVKKAKSAKKKSLAEKGGDAKSAKKKSLAEKGGDAEPAKKKSLVKKELDAKSAKKKSLAEKEREAEPAEQGKASTPAHEHGRIDDDEGRADFARLVGEIDGLVRLVEQHRPEVRRAVFDSYVTAVVEFGATARDLGLVDLRDAAFEDDNEADGEVDGGVEHAFVGDAVIEPGQTDARGETRPPAAGPRRRSFVTTAAVATGAAGPVREAEGLERATVAPRSARTSANGGRTGLDSAPPPTAPDGAAESTPDAAAPRRRVRRGTATLEELAAATPPRNNDARTALIVQAHELAGTRATLVAIEAGYTRMGWRVPVNLATSVRQTVRRGLIVPGIDGAYEPA